MFGWSGTYFDLGRNEQTDVLKLLITVLGLVAICTSNV